MTPDERAPSAGSPQKESAARSEPPSISLPKSGGAIRGLGEKFAVSPSTGTATLIVPLPISPGRDGMQPQLALAYDSGAPNWCFGLGWGVGSPVITRKTDKGLPRYVESGADSDIYLLSGAEDLVPLLDPNAGFTHPAPMRKLPDGSEWTVERYRPRIERMFTRIERWTPAAGGAAHWRTISKEGVVSLYGTSTESRISDPADTTRVFSWLISETYDLKGNAMIFGYVAEDSSGVNVSLPHERNRTDATRAANTYLKRVRYGNATPRADGENLSARTDWLFELVLDYGEHDLLDPKPSDSGTWTVREDPFSSYRARFEVRTYRLCRRLLMFHHFPQEPGVGADCLVRSLDLEYEASHVATKLASVTQSGYRREGAGYVKRSLPAVEFEYSEAELQRDVIDVDSDNLPRGVGDPYRLVDLDGEGLPGILDDHGGAWLYKRNISPLTVAPDPGNHWTAAFVPLQTEADRPSISSVAAGRTELVDIDGDGRIELAQLQPPLSGYQARTDDGSWEPFQSFASMPVLAWRDPNLRLADLTGDGHADALVTDDDAIRWQPSLAKLGFGEEERTPQAFDEERGPRLMFADGTQSTYLADLSGDGLADLVRVRNGEVCYWPNTGYGGFGAKVTMDNAPVFDTAGAFDQRRVRLADIDGSGPCDLAYIGTNGVQIYINQAGNGFAEGMVLDDLPELAEPAGVTIADLLGNGTSCLIWSSSLPGNARSPLRYVDLMGGTKPHLLVHIANNLGAETAISYAASTKFYARDRATGRPWITRLAFPVQVVERLETYDQVSRNRFVTRYAYHHGYFDGFEREFRGFACVEQWDTEEFAVLTAGGTLPATNLDLASHVPPVLTKTWYHTGAYLNRARISRQLANEYYREGDSSDGLSGLTDEQLAAMELPDTVLPTSVLQQDGTRLPHALLPEEEREACRALKGFALRQETYALDASNAEARPYGVSERNYTIELLQPLGANQHSVFMPHKREAVDFNYERALFMVNGKTVADPRVSHDLTLELDAYGNVLSAASVSYGRRYEEVDPRVPAAAREQQRGLIVSFVESAYTAPVDLEDAARAPAPAETRAYELLQANPSGAVAEVTELFGFDELTGLIAQSSDGAHELVPEDFEATGATPGSCWRRLVRRQITLYRSDDLQQVLPLGQLELLALPGAHYDLAFTNGQLDATYVRPVANGPPQALLDKAKMLGEGGYVSSAQLTTEGLLPASEPSDRWWLPASRWYLSSNAADTPAQEAAYARLHFYRPRRIRDPFGHDFVVTYDEYDLLMLETLDAAGNRIVAGTRDANGVAMARNDYRVLAPAVVSDVNRNRSAVLFDALGFVAATAVMGKPENAEGDLLAGIDPDPPEAVVLAQLANPQANPWAVLGASTTRLLYDLNAYRRSAGQPTRAPSVVCSLARETHVSDLKPAEVPRVQCHFTYSDGFGRSIQEKVPAEPGPLVDGGPDVAPRWVGSGWQVFDNKGQPVRVYEPFFTASHEFELAMSVGVSSVAFRDPIGRVIGTLHADHSLEKVVVGPWLQESWDANDASLIADPTTDPVLGDYLSRLPAADYLPTWYALRSSGTADERVAATQTGAHAGTPTVAAFDAMGRQIVTTVHNRYEQRGATVERYESTLNVLDIDSNLRTVIDELGRIALKSEFDLLGRHLRDATIDGGARWMLEDVARMLIYVWDSRGHTIHTLYDALRRPIEAHVSTAGAPDIIAERSTYGEGVANAEAANLRGKLYKLEDDAGVLTHDLYDFKGNLRTWTRAFVSSYASQADYSKAVALEPESYKASADFDALNRPIETTTPDLSVTRTIYNEAALVERVLVRLRGAQAETVFVDHVDYDAKGRRLQVLYGNGVRTGFEYDQPSEHLVRLRTSRGPAFLEDCPTPGTPPCGIQDLTYAHDAVGNVVTIRDGSQQRIFYRNTLVEPSRSFTYDAAYRLVVSIGREHLGQVAGGTLAAVPTSATDAPRVGLVHPGDGQAMATYEERFEYDACGNVLALVHRPVNPVVPSWTRTYAYAEKSQLDAAAIGNRLSSSAAGATSAPCTYDAHGNTLSMSHLQLMRWDEHDMLTATSAQVVRSGTPETTYYSYGADGERVRKTTDAAHAVGAAARRVKERRYLGGYEVYREYGSAGAVTLERETLHISVGANRIALVETRTQGNDGSPEQVLRYQHSDAAGSVSFELDDAAALISFEEYYAFGSTSYQAVRSQVDPPKRYRHLAKERDDESGFNYHGARYQAPWLGRWISVDKQVAPDALNGYLYVRDDPIRYDDPTGREEASISNRIWGGVRMLGGALQLAFGAFAVANVEVPVAAQAVGVVAMLHGSDDFATGWKQMISGKNEKNVTELAVAAAVKEFGASNATAEAIGKTTDLALGFVSPTGGATNFPRAGMVLATDGPRILAAASDTTKIASMANTANVGLHAANAGGQLLMAAAKNDGNSSSGDPGGGTGKGGGTGDSGGTGKPTTAANGKPPLPKTTGGSAAAIRSAAAKVVWRSADKVPFAVRGATADFEAVKGTGVYVLKDKAGTVLYVGEGTPFKRLGEHIADTSKTAWFGEIAQFEVRASGLTKSQSLALEEDLIKELQPLHNLDLTPYQKLFGSGASYAADLTGTSQKTLTFRVELGAAR